MKDRRAHAFMFTHLLTAVRTAPTIQEVWVEATEQCGVCGEPASVHTQEQLARGAAIQTELQEPFWKPYEGPTCPRCGKATERSSEPGWAHLVCICPERVEDLIREFGKA